MPCAYIDYRSVRLTCYEAILALTIEDNNFVDASMAVMCCEININGVEYLDLIPVPVFSEMVH